MEKLWDTDTGTLTLTATDIDGAAINLSATTARHVIVKAMATGVITELTIATTDLPNGIVRTTVTSLGAGRYQAILRVTDAAGTVTYPSADVGPVFFEVKADLDAA